MAFETPKIHTNVESQTSIDFEKAAIEFALKQKQKALDEINKKYPEAKVPIGIVEGDDINGYKVKGEDLEEYAKGQDNLYGRPDGKVDRNNEYRNGQN